MNVALESNRPGPLLLLGRQRESLHLLSGFALGRGCSVVRTPDRGTVETMAAALAPAAVILEATDLYREGRAVASRVKESARGARVIFLDVEGAWAAFMEFDSDESNDLRVQACVVDDLGKTLLEFLGSGGCAAEAGRFGGAGGTAGPDPVLIR